MERLPEVADQPRTERAEGNGVVGGALTAAVPGRQRISRGTLKHYIKFLTWPGTNWVGREKSRIVNQFFTDEKRSLWTLDCGCGNLYFSYAAHKRGSNCVAITINEREAIECARMRDFLGIPQSQLEVEQTDIASYHRNNPEARERFDQVLLFDVIEHIRDDAGTLRQIHEMLNEHGFVYITVPNRDFDYFQGKAHQCRYETGWHVRNGYTFEQLEKLLEEAGFECVNRLRFGNFGSVIVWWLQVHAFGRFRDPLTILTFPLLKLLTILFYPFRATHTIGVVARKA